MKRNEKKLDQETDLGWSNYLSDESNRFTCFSDAGVVLFEFL